VPTKSFPPTFKAAVRARHEIAKINIGRERVVRLARILDRDEPAIIDGLHHELNKLKRLVDEPRRPPDGNLKAAFKKSKNLARQLRALLKNPAPLVRQMLGRAYSMGDLMKDPAPLLQQMSNRAYSAVLPDSEDAGDDSFARDMEALDRLYKALKHCKSEAVSRKGGPIIAIPKPRAMKPYAIRLAQLYQNCTAKTFKAERTEKRGRPAAEFVLEALAMLIPDSTLRNRKTAMRYAGIKLRRRRM
jgi:hypothetical protein